MRNLQILVNKDLHNVNNYSKTFTSRPISANYLHTMTSTTSPKYRLAKFATVQILSIKINTRLSVM